MGWSDKYMSNDPWGRDLPPVEKAKTEPPRPSMADYMRAMDQATAEANAAGLTREIQGNAFCLRERDNFIFDRKAELLALWRKEKEGN